MRLRTSNAGAAAALALFLVFALPLIAVASSYWSTLDYTWRVWGSTRTYDNDDMNLSLTCSTTNGSSGSHYVQLWRDRTFPLSDQNLGQRTLTRKGYSNVDWYDVGSGKYFFYFEKAQDGVRVYSDDLHMYSN